MEQFLTTLILNTFEKMLDLKNCHCQRVYKKFNNAIDYQIFVCSTVDIPLKRQLEIKSFIVNDVGRECQYILEQSDTKKVILV